MILSPRQALADVLLALLLAIVGGVLAALIGQALMIRLGVPLVLSLMFQGLIILLGLQLLLSWRRQGWGLIGLGALRLRDLGLGLIALLAVFALNAGISLFALQVWPEVFEQHQAQLTEFAFLLTGELPVLVIAGTMLFTAFYEEVLARGFLLQRCRVLIGGIWGPVLLSSILFGLGHAYQGWVGVVQTALVGIVFARLALYWGRLWPLILAHAALNTISLLALRTM